MNQFPNWFVHDTGIVHLGNSTVVFDTFRTPEAVLVLRETAGGIGTMDDASCVRMECPLLAQKEVSCVTAVYTTGDLIRSVTTTTHFITVLCNMVNIEEG